MEKRLKAENGILIKFIIEKLKKEMSTRKTRKNKKIKKSSKLLRLSTSDWKNLNLGFEILEKAINTGFDEQMRKLLLGKKDVSKIQKEITGYSDVIGDFVHRISKGVENEYELKQYESMLPNYYKIVQAARDGIIIKKEKRTEYINGEKKEKTYDTSMTPNEALEIIVNYEEELSRIRINKINNYMGLGLGLISVMGALLDKDKDSKEKQNVPLITLGTIIVPSLKLLRVILTEEDRKKAWNIMKRQDRIAEEMLNNEQISYEAEKIMIKNINNLNIEENKIKSKIDDKVFSFNIAIDLVMALISGAYINNIIKTKPDGKIDGESLALALRSLMSSKGIAGYFASFIQNTAESKKNEVEFKELCKKAQDILKQMEEKVYSIEGAKHPFDSIKINNLTGKFYPKKDYETGKTNYSTIIKIPEFSMKRGDIVLLSGESGNGKSTFLRLLKRGDINNRKAIELDNGEKVDSLGNEYIAFKPSTNLGDETNVLYQITGKNSISDLTKEEKEKLLSILEELKMDSTNILEDIATKKFMEFSTGQQKRLALSKMFYLMNDENSVIIVDEPVGNVEDNLIREQLEMIKNYAQSKNLMLILTTHRLDLVEDLVTKKYNINTDGVLEQLPIQKKEEIYTR